MQLKGARVPTVVGGVFDMRMHQYSMCIQSSFSGDMVKYQLVLKLEGSTCLFNDSTTQAIQRVQNNSGKIFT